MGTPTFQDQPAFTHGGQRPDPPQTARIIPRSLMVLGIRHWPRHVPERETGHEQQRPDLAYSEGWGVGEGGKREDLSTGGSGNRMCHRPLGSLRPATSRIHDRERPNRPCDVGA